MRGAERGYKKYTFAFTQKTIRKLEGGKPWRGFTRLSANRFRITFGSLSRQIRCRMHCKTMAINLSLRSATKITEDTESVTDRVYRVQRQ
jgi:hypothetical protein